MNKKRRRPPDNRLSGGLVGEVALPPLFRFLLYEHEGPRFGDILKGVVKLVVH